MMSFGIPERIFSDGGTQYRRKILEAVYEYLDIQGLKTTDFQPACKNQSERTVQTTKQMIKCHIEEDQDNWELI